MKKFYTIALAAAVALTASAEVKSLNVNRPVDFKNNAKSTKNFKRVSKAELLTIENENAARIAKSKVDGKFTIDGDYRLQIGDWYAGNYSEGYVTIDATITREGNDLSISEGSYYYTVSDIPATYNEETKEVTVVSAALGRQNIQGQLFYMTVEPFYYDYDEEDMFNIESFTGKFNEVTGVIDFDGGDGDYGVMWNLYSDAAYSNYVGGYAAVDIYKATQINPDKEPLDEVMADQWYTVGSGTATLVDGWVIPVYTRGGLPIVNTDYPVEVEVQRNRTNQNLYRLWKPYNNSQHTLAGNNVTEFEGQIILDLEDPNNVVVVAAGHPSGFANDNGEFYVTNLLGYWIKSNGDYNGVESNPLVEGNLYAALKNLVLQQILPQRPGYVHDKLEGNVVTIDGSNHVFSYSDDYTGLRAANAPQATIITLPADYSGVNDVIVTENDEAVEYYNLQGVRVANPTAGQLVIKKQGGNVTKVTVK